MGGITHSEAVVFRRGVWYLLLMLVVGLFAYGMYRSAVFLEEVISEPRGSGLLDENDPPKSYSQYEEVLSIHTQQFLRTAPPSEKPTKKVYPVTRNLTNDEGKTIEAEILGRPELDKVKFRRVSDNLIFTIPLSALHDDDSEFVKTLPFLPNE